MRADVSRWPGGFRVGASGPVPCMLARLERKGPHSLEQLAVPAVEDGLGGASGGQLLLLKGLPLWLHLCSHLLPSVLEELNSYFQKNKMRKVPEKKQDKLEFKCSKLSLSSVVLQVPEESPEKLQ